MALIQMGAIVTKIRGKIAGTVFSNSVSGNVMRNKTIPRRSSSQLQSGWHGNVKYWSQNWLAVSPTDQALWAAFASNFEFRNKLGAAVPAAPNLVYQTLQRYYFAANGSLLALPGDYVTPPLLTTVAGNISPDSPLANITFDATSEDCYICVYASRSFRYGQQAIMKSRLRLMVDTELLSASATDVTFTTQYFDAFPNGPPGQYAWVAYRVIHIDSYVWSPLFYILVENT